MNIPARVDAIIGLRREEIGSTVVGHVPIAAHTRSAAGGLHTGVLLAALDATGGLACGLASLPAWTVSTSLMGVMSEHAHTGPLRLDANVLRVSRARVVASVDIRDEGNDDLRVGHGLLTASVLDPAEGPPPFERPLRSAPAPLAVPDLEDAFGIEPSEGPTTRLELRDGLRNRWRILHGGAVALLVDVAAVRAAGGGMVSSTVLHFLAPARTGPVEARCTVLGQRDGTVVVRVSAHDTGHDDRRVALASATVVNTRFAQHVNNPSSGPG
jgi:acyl-coenzyme A thioesterase PaaI-like protein